MDRQSGKGVMVLLTGGLLLGLCVAAVVQAQVIHPDQMIGVPSLQSESLPDSAMPNEPPGDLERGSDRQMAVPEDASAGSMDTNMLKTPDAIDAENARESDSRSAHSF